MEENNQPIQNNEEKLNELTTLLTNLEFLSDDIRYKAVIYNGLNRLIEKINSIEQNVAKLLDKQDAKVQI